LEHSRGIFRREAIGANYEGESSARYSDRVHSSPWLCAPRDRRTRGCVAHGGRRRRAPR
jgi:hypothetical protein